MQQAQVQGWAEHDSQLMKQLEEKRRREANKERKEVTRTRIPPL